MIKIIFLCLVGFFIAPGPLSFAEEPMQLVILGTGTPFPDPTRSGPALAIIKNGTSYLVDAGPGIVRRASAASTKHNIPSLEAQNLKTAFLTHLHTDHTVGLPDLIFSSWVMDRAQPLQLFGPTGTKAMASYILMAYQEDIKLRLEGLEPATEDGYKVDTTEFMQGATVLETENIKVESFPVLHGSWEQAYGYVFSDGKAKIVISGDARPSPTLITAAMGADILVHEVYSVEGFKKRPKIWQKYHASFHTSTHELAEIAKKAKPKLLVLYHQLYWGFSDEDLIREIREAGYEGDVISASDLDIFPINLDEVD